MAWKWKTNLGIPESLVGQLGVYGRRWKVMRAVLTGDVVDSDARGGTETVSQTSRPQGQADNVSWWNMVGELGSWGAPGWITLLWLVDSGFLAVQTVVGIFLFCGVPLRFSGGQTKQVSQSDMVSGLPVCCIESVDMTAKILLCHAQHTDVFLAQMWPRVANRWTRPGSQFWGASWGSWFVTAWSKRKKCPFTLNFLWQEVTLNWVPRSRSSNIKWSTERRVWILGGMGTRERDLGWQQVWICHLSQGELGGRHHKALEEADAGQRVQSHPTYPR